MKLIDLPHDAVATFVERPNRFLAIADIPTADGVESIRQKVHVHDPGRLREILLPGSEIMLKRATNPNRKTKWDLLSGKVDGRWVFIHSGHHRMISESLLLSDLNPFGTVTGMKAEVMVGNSRMDFVAEMEYGGRLTIEVKGCSLARDGVALFPDAPTERGTRHLRELMNVAQKGERAGLLSLVFRWDSECFLPNGETDPKFESTFWEAMDSGMEYHAVKVEYDGSAIRYVGEIPLCGDR